ncbi:MAG: cellulose-binding protein, partial [Kineosporiaceae bacterium]
HADKALSEAKAEAERNRRAAQRQVDELIRQRDSITGHLDQLRSLLTVPQPAVGASEAKA